MDINNFVELSVKQNASDLHLCTGQRPMLRIDGELTTDELSTPLTHEQLAALSEAWLDSGRLYELRHKGHADAAVTLASGRRVRVNFFRQFAGLSLALRPLPQHCPNLSDLQAPEVLRTLSEQEDGLILITGATGSGKSTTLAAVIGYLNQTRTRHIITLEDPIEFLHNSQRCLIQQREMGTHTPCFTEAIRAALREDPDVLLLGELRDTQSIRLALTAAETGHLVLATLHARHAAQAVDRLIDVFPAEEKAFVRAQLAGSLRGILAQRLVASRQGGRVALYEMLTSTPAVCNLIREGKTHQLQDSLQTGSGAGMQTFEQSRQQRSDSGLL
ncbi:type IV pili twitching motility protein PilT [Rouxiella silvae]|uniref:PilT/PilU family type 4a pilus ATPase n=1 Tax=Rouxiella silvae TaxID=1646373 RepID=A0AA40X049_9GAMM|nr:PilT/PilU family type 4a pilus ATPase [Rouxiella silvae]MBF6636039.1 PilT/PilU family type 4a pilus ATPase [Rouxiella silvae]ORJ19312.1 type IV pili twitching motility protein PilT [Rouxiella silvae]